MDEDLVGDGKNQIRPELILSTQKDADKLRAGYSDEDIKTLRNHCKFDLFFLLKLLGYKNIDVNLHGEYCAWLEANRDWQYLLTLLPRGHYKSTVNTVGDSIQTALPLDLHSSSIPYPYNLGTNVRICIVHDVALMAQQFLRIITQQFLTNPFLISLYPECVPNPKRNRINLSGLELPREASWGEPTFDTMGVGARGQGNHYNKLKLDDIYGEAARDSQTEREAHIQWFDNVQSFCITPAADIIHITGTRWAFDDVYAHAMNVYNKDESGKLLENPQLKTFIRSVYKDNTKLSPIFPAQYDESGRIVAGFTLEKLNILKKNKKVWNAQYINDPKEGAAKFQPEWKRFFDWSGPSKRNILVTEKKTLFNNGSEEEISFEELDRLILVDPALDGLSGIVVTGTDRKKRVYILEAIKGSYPPEQLRNLIFQLVAKYNPRLVAIEDVLFSALFEVWFRTEMAIRGMRFRIEPVKTGQKQKELRVNGLSNFFEAGQIHFHPSQHQLIDEFDQFGATDDYHMLDALAYGPRLWRAGNNQPKKDINSLANQFLGRSVATGYSKI